MKSASLAAAVLALSTGIAAAIYWYRSSKVQIEPMWPSGAGGLVEPGEREEAQESWIGGTLMAFSASADLNAKAAIWTAVSVLLAGIASILSAV